MDKANSNPLADLTVADYTSYQLVSHVFISCLTVSRCLARSKEPCLQRVPAKAYAYDWLSSIAEECEIVVNSGLTPSNALYFVSRCVSPT